MTEQDPVATEQVIILGTMLLDNSSIQGISEALARDVFSDMFAVAFDWILRVWARDDKPSRVDSRALVRFKSCLSIPDERGNEGPPSDADYKQYCTWVALWESTARQPEIPLDEAIKRLLHHRTGEKIQELVGKLGRYRNPKPEHMQEMAAIAHAIGELSNNGISIPVFRKIIKHTEVPPIYLLDVKMGERQAMMKLRADQLAKITAKKHLFFDWLGKYPDYLPSAAQMRYILNFLMDTAAEIRHAEEGQEGLQDQGELDAREMVEQFLREAGRTSQLQKFSDGMVYAPEDGSYEGVAWTGVHAYVIKRLTGGNRAKQLSHILKDMGFKSKKVEAGRRRLWCRARAPELGLEPPQDDFEGVL